MKCSTIDKLSQYADDLVTGQELDDLRIHVESCGECQRVVEAFVGEQQFIKETLQTPVLPDDFAASVLEQLEPYEQKKVRRGPWKRVMLTAAAMTFAVGLSAALNPSFAEWIGVGGMFSTDEADAIVDEGLKMAANDDLVERVNLEVMDNGLTFKVEDVVADSSRVALSYQILDQDGKPKDTRFDWFDSENKITVTGQNGTILDQVGTGWQEGSDYGLVEFSLREQDGLEGVTVNFDLVELDGVKGNWKLEVPIDLKEKSDLTTVVSLKDATTSEHGVTVHMKELQFAPSSTELLYETGFTQEEAARVEGEIQQLEAQLGKGTVTSKDFSTKFGTAIKYHIENEEKKTIFKQDDGSFFTEESEPGDLSQYERSGYDTGKLGQVVWTESFIPQKGDRKLTFVLDGIYKTVPSDFSVTVKPKELKKNPVSFEYEGNFMTIKKAKNQGEYSLQKSIIPIERETAFTIEMEGGMEALASTLGEWILVDDKGNSYPVFGEESILKEKDKNGRHKATMGLKVYDLDEIPEEFTLHLISVTRYEGVKEKWEVPLYEVD